MQDQTLPSDAAPRDEAPRGDRSTGLDRRSFLTTVGGAAALGASGVIVPALIPGGTKSAQALPPPNGSMTDGERATAAYRVRVQCATQNLNAPLVSHPTNGDETLYPDRIGNFSKSLPHNAFGEVSPSAYQTFLDACAAGTQAAFEGVPSGCPNSQRRLKLTNPLGGLAYDLEGVDGHNTTVPAAPAFASAEAAGEIVENYWMALLRDIPISQYPTHSLVAQACQDLSALSDFRGPKEGGVVTPQTLFRDPAYGVTTGPFLSQFWWRSQPFGAQHVEPRMRTILPGHDYLTSEALWLGVQNGNKPTTSIAFDNSTLRYMRNGRDLSRWVHMDVLYQAYFQALLHLAAPKDVNDPFTGGGMGCPPNPGNPYNVSLMQDGFTTFGGPYFAGIFTEVATRGLKATWYQKWFVHRRLRPEEFGGRVHNLIAHGRPYPIHPDVLNSQALAAVQSQYGTSLLPMAFPEGCPIHPAYTAGHATVAGACVTIIKALFYTDQPFPNPIVIPTDDGLGLVPYTGPGANQMTVTGELNKLAMNVAYGRNVAGVHWRTDGYASLRLGEEIAISILRDQRACYAENFSGFTFRKFDGSYVTV